MTYNDWVQSTSNNEDSLWITKSFDLSLFNKDTKKNFEDKFSEYVENTIKNQNYILDSPTSYPIHKSSNGLKSDEIYRRYKI